jgi:hypothetical protein
MPVGLFEEHPWTLILLVIVISEAWSAVKRLAARIWRILPESSKVLP